MRGARLAVVGSLIGLAGFAVLVAEAAPAVLGHTVLGSVGQLLLWLGLGGMAAGGVLLIVGVWTAATEAAAAAPLPDDN